MDQPESGSLLRGIAIFPSAGASIDGETMPWVARGINKSTGKSEDAS